MQAQHRVTSPHILQGFTVRTCAGPSSDGSGHSPSVMFIIYMVIGFTATLACIMILTLLYFLIRQARLLLTVRARKTLNLC